MVGALLLVLALRNWRNRPAPGEQPDMPKWMDGIDRLAPGRAPGLGVLLAGVNPKNLALTVGRGDRSRPTRLKPPTRWSR